LSCRGYGAGPEAEAGIAPGCPACAGRRFKFPADLADSQDRMCQAHQKEADALIKRRMARAEASNPAGWRMTADASARLSLPHLPGGVATRLKAAENDPVLRAPRCSRR
jgi:predicted  nucleic acid-binding Zn-ribbon protein